MLTCNFTIVYNGVFGCGSEKISFVRLFRFHFRSVLRLRKRIRRERLHRHCQCQFCDTHRLASTLTFLESNTFAIEPTPLGLWFIFPKKFYGIILMMSITSISLLYFMCDRVAQLQWAFVRLNEITFEMRIQLRLNPEVMSSSQDIIMMRLQRNVSFESAMKFNDICLFYIKMGV